MSRIETIKHDGIVESIGAGKVTVRILQASACSSCRARQLCRSSESKEKLMEVRGHYPTLHVGDSVTLVGSVRQGIRASVLAYIVPLVLMLVVLFLGTHHDGEGMGAWPLAGSGSLLRRALSAARQMKDKLAGSVLV